jgi:hypothetical protein
MPLAVELEECVILLSKTYNDNTSFHSHTRHFFAAANYNLIMNFDHVQFTPVCYINWSRLDTTSYSTMQNGNNEHG